LEKLSPVKVSANMIKSQLEQRVKLSLPVSSEVADVQDTFPIDVYSSL
jgi:hypothetical protein